MALTLVLDTFGFSLSFHFAGMKPSNFWDLLLNMDSRQLYIAYRC